MFIAFSRTLFVWLFITQVVTGLPYNTAAQEQAETQPTTQAPMGSGESVQDYNLRLQHLDRLVDARDLNSSSKEYRIGPGDLLEISVMDAPELSRAARVSEGGQISLSLLGVIPAAGKTPRQVESALEDLLRQRYMKDPHVSVFVKEMQSHSVSVFGAVKKPGVYQIRGPKRLVEVLSMAEGLADDAGDTALVIHQSHRGFVVDTSQNSGSAIDAERRPASAGTASRLEVSTHSEATELFLEPTQEINLKSLIDSDDPRSNVLVFPADEVKVTRAGIVYVVGEVKKSGGFQLKGNEKISVLQALALAEGLTSTSARSQARIIRTDGTTGKRNELPIDLGKILAGKASDPGLQPRDILFIPNSTGRSALYRGIESAVSVGTGLAIYRR